MAGVSQPSPLLPARQRAQALVNGGDLAGARAVLERAVELGKVNLSEDDPDVLVTAFQLGTVLQQADDPMAARRVLEEAYAAGQWRLGDADPLMVQISHDLGVVAEELGNRHEARKAFGRVAEHGPGALGADHPGVLRARAYLGQGQNPGAVRPEPAQPAPPSTLGPPPQPSPAGPYPGTVPQQGAGPRPGTIPQQSEGPHQGHVPQPRMPATGAETGQNREEAGTRFRLEPGPVPRPGNFEPTPATSDEVTTTLNVGPAADADGEETSAFEVIPLGTRGGRVLAPAELDQRDPPTEAHTPVPPTANQADQPTAVHLADQPTTVHPIVTPRTQLPSRAVPPPPAEPAPQTKPAGPHQAAPQAQTPSGYPGQQPMWTQGGYPAQPQAGSPDAAHGQPQPGVPMPPTAPTPSGHLGQPQTEAPGGPQAQPGSPLHPHAQTSANPYPGVHGLGTYPIVTPAESPASSAYGKKGVGLFAAIAAGLSAVIAVVALVFVLASRSGEKGDDPQEPTLGGAPPGNVQLQDEGSRIRVTWTDPSEGTVSFMVAMAHPGEQLKPVGTLGPGETSYEMTALNPNLDYCFAVIAVYRNNQFATSEQACTERPSTGG